MKPTAASPAEMAEAARCPGCWWGASASELTAASLVEPDVRVLALLSALEAIVRPSPLPIPRPAAAAAELDDGAPLPAAAAVTGQAPVSRAADEPRASKDAIVGIAVGASLTASGGSALAAPVPALLMAMASFEAKKSWPSSSRVDDASNSEAPVGSAGSGASTIRTVGRTTDEEAAIGA